MSGLVDIAKKITEHLQRFESDPKINQPREGSRIKPFFSAYACRYGRYVRVSYVSFQGSSSLTRGEALQYLAWLDGGNVGTHWKMKRENERE